MFYKKSEFDSLLFCIRDFLYSVEISVPFKDTNVSPHPHLQKWIAMAFYEDQEKWFNIIERIENTPSYPEKLNILMICVDAIEFKKGIEIKGESLPISDKIYDAINKITFGINHIADRISFYDKTENELKAYGHDIADFFDASTHYFEYDEKKFQIKSV